MHRSNCLFNLKTVTVFKFGCLPFVHPQQVNFGNSGCAACICIGARSSRTVRERSGNVRAMSKQHPRNIHATFEQRPLNVWLRGVRVVAGKQSARREISISGYHPKSTMARRPTFIFISARSGGLTLRPILM